MSEMRPERSIVSARASVMMYDEIQKRWNPAGSAADVAKIQIYQHMTNCSFRVVGRQLHDSEVVINCAIHRTLKYNQATDTFHQWRDNKQVYGLNFSSKEDATLFANAMCTSLETLNTPSPPQHLPPPAPSMMNTTNGGGLMHNGVVDHDRDNNWQQQMLVMQNNNNNNRQVSQQSQNYEGVNQYPPRSTSNAPMPPQQQQHMYPQQQIYQQQKLQHPVYQQPHQHSSELIYEGGGSSTGGCGSEEYGGSHGSSHYGGSDGGYESHPHIVSNTADMERRLSLQQASPLAHVNSSPSMIMCSSPTSSRPHAPPVPPPLPGQVPPVPPPPPMPALCLTGSTEQVGGLAAALQATKLRKTNRDAPASNGYGTLGRQRETSSGGGGGMASMMDEMQRTLARRRAKVERSEEDSSSSNHGYEKVGSPAESSNSPVPPGTRKNRHLDGGGSESSLVESLGSSSVRVNGDRTEDTSTFVTASLLETTKKEILAEFRKEMAKMKIDIIEAIRSELQPR